MLEVFHFFRPEWLLLLPVIVGLWWIIRPKKKSDQALTEGLAPHLAQALLIGANEDRRFYPIDTLALALALLTLAVAGPTWSRMPNPLLAQTAPLVVALQVTPSMEETDVQPSRLQRAGFKIIDLVKQRSGAQTALIAYAGSAHRVAPLTQDPNIISSYLQGLSAATMPKEGDQADEALTLALTELSRAETPGAILFVLDDFNPANLTAFTENADERAPVVFLIAGPETLKIPQLESIPNSDVVHMSVDDSDIKQIERTVLSAYRKALLEDETQAWNDRGWILAWPVALLILLTFRRGWTMQWAIVLLLMLPFPRSAQADVIKDWFFTSDQQGQMAYANKDFTEAATHFQDPAWRAYTLFISGQYEEATEAYSRIETSDGALGEGMALLRNRKYRDGVRAFEKALERDPTNEAAQHNLIVAQAIVAYVESTQSQSDTGEEAGIGADETIFDNESGLGAETQIERGEEAAASLTDEQWMRSVDTDVSDFLRTRFMLETSEGNP
ncbi:VWA domain-containing protein [Falsihalocynthiibacter sp. BN13B15]|uniref:VWA domain-containing protein n=1 Tax=Falsihalocynthiibacter sp. BN13B15 TaxID=3240871 RepID=UPI00350F107C